MKEKPAELSYKRSLFSIKSYIFYFLIIASAITCCILLFLNHLEVEYGSVYESGKLTAMNVILISLIVTVLDGIYRKITLEYPMKRILKASQKMIEGDFSVRIPLSHNYDSTNELDVLTENFNRIAEELSSVETLRTDFVSNVSHEIKTPLSVIQNYAALLQDTDIPDENKREYAGAIVDACRRLTGLITNILKLNKLENQQIFPEAREFDLNTQLSECMIRLDDVLERMDLDLETDLEERVKVKSDEELLELVWNNLLSNAIKFTQPGGKIKVSLKREETAAVIKISDTGCGISSDVGKRIFEKFYQGDSSHATQGNGLGLALVKRVVDIIGGDISVESKLGEGTTFTVRLKNILAEAQQH
ncbi:HAMP domain-containing sensor histidine kinase [Clostridium transplantifaecale]|uniref:HAMP domain-containing sensor histidine kinase n=1 Tax=Clostridium transplantifaecale TaxID=2479838 RepID=UPI000F62FB54|nr:HAMP domain-containing sensor histidine kinase [Clostridium transplantifaecale]